MFMHLSRSVVVVLAIVSASTVVATPVAAQQLPAPPAPVAVSLDPATTALLVLDVTTQTCSPQPNCMAMVPRIAGLLDAARAAGVFVLYSTPATQPPIFPEVAPVARGPRIVRRAPDRLPWNPLHV